MLLERRVKMNEDEGFFHKKNSLLLELGVSFFYCRCVILVVGGHVSLHLSPNIAGCCPP